jgi:glutamate-5-semialdehyde dehydrogenase
MATASSQRKNRALEAMAQALQDQKDRIAAANAVDMDKGRENGLSGAMLDRLELTPARVDSMAAGLRTLVGLPDPVGRVDSTWLRPNGLEIKRIRVPIGVIAIIYESRPNVTVDAGALCLKAGNAVILRGGSEAFSSNRVLAEIMEESGSAAGLPTGTVQLVPWTDREAVRELLRLDEFVNLVIPRGGKGLIRTVVETSTIPVIKHYEGICHVYVDKAADLDMALSIVENGKCQRPGVCNAVETLLIHRDAAAEFAPRVAALLRSRGVELRGDAGFCALVPEAVPASEEDWSTEYLDLILSVRIVDSIEQAMDHIAAYGSAHSDCIVSDDRCAAARFAAEVDSAAVYVNASTRFTDGGQFGMGAEIGISTDRIHARGPMGVDELTTYKYIVHGTGQIRD